MIHPTVGRPCILDGVSPQLGQARPQGWLRLPGDRWPHRPAISGFRSSKPEVEGSSNSERADSSSSPSHGCPPLHGRRCPADAGNTTFGCAKRRQPGARPWPQSGAQTVMLVDSGLLRRRYVGLNWLSGRCGGPRTRAGENRGVLRYTDEADAVLTRQVPRHKRLSSDHRQSHGRLTLGLRDEVSDITHQRYESAQPEGGSPASDLAGQYQRT
jgi:hypothetical protein